MELALGLMAISNFLVFGFAANLINRCKFHDRQE